MTVKRCNTIVCSQPAKLLVVYMVTMSEGTMELLFQKNYGAAFVGLSVAQAWYVWKPC